MLRRGAEYLPAVRRAHSGLRFGTGLYFSQLVSRVKARDSGGVFGPDCFGVKCCDRHGASVRRLLERELFAAPVQADLLEVFRQRRGRPAQTYAFFLGFCDAFRLALAVLFPEFFFCDYSEEFGDK